MIDIDIKTKISSLLSLYKSNPKEKYTVQELSEITNINFNYRPLQKWLENEGVLTSTGTKIIKREIKGGYREFPNQFCRRRGGSWPFLRLSPPLGVEQQTKARPL